MAYVTLLPSDGQAASLASDVTPSSGRHFQLLKQAVQSVYRFKEGPPGVTPMLMTGELQRGSVFSGL